MVRNERISMQKAQLNDIVLSMTQHISPIKQNGNSPSLADLTTNYRTDDRVSCDNFFDTKPKLVTRFMDERARSIGISASCKI